MKHVHDDREDRAPAEPELAAAPAAPAATVTPIRPAAPSRLARLARELREHPFGYTVLGLFLVAGPVLAPLIFPEAPPAVAVVGGLAFGAYAALCAVPQKFL